VSAATIITANKQSFKTLKMSAWCPVNIAPDSNLGRIKYRKYDKKYGELLFCCFSFAHIGTSETAYTKIRNIKC